MDDADIDELRRQDNIVKGISNFDTSVNIRKKRFTRKYVKGMRSFKPKQSKLFGEL